MIWASLLLFHLVGLVGYTLLLRRSALSSINKYLLASLMQTAIFLPSIIFFLQGKVSFDHSATEWLALVGSGFMLIGLHITSIKALQHLEASVFTIIYNLRLFITTILGYFFLNELPAKLQVLGGMIIFASIIMLNLHKNRLYFSKPMLIGFFTVTWFSFHAVLEKHNVSTNGFENYMFISGGLGVIGLWSLAIVKKAKIKTLKKTFDKKTAMLLVARPMSAWGYTYALKYGSLAVTNYISGLSVALIVLFGVLVLGERDHLRQKIRAVAVALVGMTLILISRI